MDNGINGSTLLGRMDRLEHKVGLMERVLEDLRDESVQQTKYLASISKYLIGAVAGKKQAPSWLFVLLFTSFTVILAIVLLRDGHKTFSMPGFSMGEAAK